MVLPVDWREPWAVPPEVRRRVFDSRGLGDPGRAEAFAALNRDHRTIKLHLTPACNLSCKNCYNDARRPRALDAGEIRGLLDQLRAHPARLDLLGGEPTLHPGLADVIRYARTEGGVREVFLYTNATLVDDAAAERLREAGLDTAIVSLHSPKAEVHEALTGQPGSFAATCRGLQALARAGVRTYTFTVVCALNSGTLAQMQEFAAARGLGALFFPYVPQRPHDELAISDPQELREAISFVVRASYVYRTALLRSLGDGCKLCRAFTQTVTVLSDGTVTPCPFVALPLGNVREAPLYDILARAASDPRLAELLAVPDECAACTIRSVCGGGCKAGRFTVHGELGRRDLACLHGPYLDPVSVSALPEHLPYVY
jgi:AdoMet-dependent heme synthase